VSRDYHAKRLAKELGIPYAEALRRVRAERAHTATDPPPENVTPPS
jgi:hypothetical protein